MDRRAFLGALGLIAAPLVAEAQPAARVYRIAYVAIAPRTPAEVAEQPPYRAFVAELRRLGYLEGQNLRIDRWTAAGRVEHYHELARDVAQSQPDLIVAASDQLLLRLKAATTTPIVGITADPVAIGLASSLGRPGANVTGFTVGPDDVLGKHVELLRLAVPSASTNSLSTLSGRMGWPERARHA
jgi:putative ABC transport system substrate-binding protein